MQKIFETVGSFTAPLLQSKIDCQIGTWCLHPIATRALARWRQAGRKKGVKEVYRTVEYTRPFQSSEVALYKIRGFFFLLLLSPLSFLSIYKIELAVTRRPVFEFSASEIIIYQTLAHSLTEIRDAECKRRSPRKQAP
jgi:hypothetical protein